MHKPSSFRTRFTEFVLPMFSALARQRITGANLQPSQIPTTGWMTLSMTTPSRNPNRGMLPDTYNGNVITPQSILRGVTPVDNLALATLRAKRANATGGS